MSKFESAITHTVIWFFFRTNHRLEIISPLQGVSHSEIYICIDKYLKTDSNLTY
jgi:hypothetical protein